MEESVEKEKISDSPGAGKVSPIRTSMEQDFQPELLTTARATTMGYPTEQTLHSESIHTTSSVDDLEKGVVAPILVQQALGANEFEKSDVMPVQEGPSSRRSHSSGNPAWRISIPPQELRELPYKRDWRVWRTLRHNLINVYQRLFSVVFIANMIAFIVLLAKYRNAHPSGPPLTDIATAASANILCAILIRQENVINSLYWIFRSTPVSWPLRLRRTIAKFYHFGGVHSGCGVSAATWFILFTGLITRNYVSGDLNEPAIMAITYILLILFLSICLFAIPKFRIFSHNSFEAVHRFAGWTAVGLFWVEILLVSNAQSKIPGSESLGLIVAKTPAFWILLVITFFIILPWLRLRQVEAFPEVLSSHAVRIRFKYMKIGPVLGIRITHNPLKEWHAFASIPEADGSSFSLIVSDAGDWTRDQIVNPKSKYWVRGIPTTGVLRMAEVFKRVVIVTTGSGIGPCLSMLIGHPLDCRIIWSTPNPVQTYGESIVDAVAKADPQAMIINTRASGRPDMVALTYHMYLECGAEAVFCISNPALTRKVVYGMESRGVPAYGPIWDS
ncbi:hypothetical protein MMC07_001785 [Pseudocyphellaria aurata]|nr:hypothetical protein [Pseudocyphellaria aurata]